MLGIKMKYCFVYDGGHSIWTVLTLPDLCVCYLFVFCVFQAKFCVPVPTGHTFAGS